MGAFVDVYLPAAVPGYPCMATPRTSTTITQVSGGDEGRNQNWKHPLRKFQLPEAARDWTVVQDLLAHWLAMAGPFSSFPFRDPLDFASVGLLVPNEPTADVLARITAEDQALGTGDGATRTFQLVKTYTRGPASYVRTIGLPIVADLLVADAGTVLTEGTDYTVTRPGGVVTFAVAPADGHALTWGGLFDVPVRFDADDGFDSTVKSFQVAGFAQLNLDEVRLC